jgi:betaine-aldehyde dehydrogenase
MDQPIVKQDALFIAGEWRRGRGCEIGAQFAADGAINGRPCRASVEDVDLAIECAQDAVHDKTWRKLRAHDRASSVYRIAEAIEPNVERISDVQSRDTGKTAAKTRALALSAAGTWRDTAAALETMEDALTPSRGSDLSLSVHEPLCVAAGITPSNSPTASDAQKVAPAPAAGNGSLSKPSSGSPLVCLELARIIEAAGLPRGLFSTLPGAGAVVGERLVTHSAIRKVSFTGGTDTARDIARKAADKLMPVSLKLGGKPPTIVFADADLVACAGTYEQFSISTPFGATTDSGIGREKGRAGIRACMSQKSLYFDLSAQPHPWARVGANQ